MSDEIPSAALLASLSASSLPSIPSCPAVHLRANLSLRLPFFLSSLLAKRMNCLAMWCPGLRRSDWNAFRAAWLSQPIAGLIPVSRSAHRYQSLGLYHLYHRSSYTWTCPIASSLPLLSGLEKKCLNALGRRGLWSSLMVMIFDLLEGGASKIKWLTLCQQ